MATAQLTRQLTRMLEERKRIKSKKPEFLIQDYHKRKELPRKWRRPRGMHSKMRMRIKGHPKHVEIGYSSPKEARHLDRQGMKRVMVSNPDQLKKIDREREAAVINHGVGIRKRLWILEAAEKEGIRVVNAKAAKLKEKLESRKRVKEERVKEERAKGKKTEEGKKEEIKGEKQEDAGKKEKDKLLTKRQI